MFVRHHGTLLGHHLQTLHYGIGHLPLLVASQDQVHTIEDRNLLGLQLGITACHHHHCPGMVSHQTVYGLTALAVGHLSDATRVYHTHIGHLALACRAYPPGLQSLAYRTGLGKVQLTAQGIVYRLLVFHLVHRVQR